MKKGSEALICSLQSDHQMDPQTTYCTFNILYLYNVSQVAVRSQLQPLPLSPGLDGGQSLSEHRTPIMRPQTCSASVRSHEAVEEPGADEVEELREELYGEGRVDPTATQKGHSGHQSV